MKKALCVLALWGAALGLAQAQDFWQEDAVGTPPTLQPSRLIPFDLSTRTELQYAVDGGSVQIGADRVIRYILVARSPSGAENILYEGLRCETGETRTYARWNKSEQRWVTTTGAVHAWRPLSGVAASAPAARLAYLSFCEGRTPTEPLARMLSELKTGGRHVGLR